MKIKFAIPILLLCPLIDAVANDINFMGRISNHNSEDKFTSGLYSSKFTYGMRANAVVLAASANPPDNNGYPINGFNYTKALSGYADRDSVALYADNNSIPFKSWEEINIVNYTASSATSKNLDESRIKPGMFVEAKSKPSWSAYVVSVDNNKIITNGWVNNESHRMGTPPNGAKLVINPNTKIWAANFNILLHPEGRAKSAVIQENGLINNNQKDPNTVNGIDTVILPASKFGGTAAYIARSAVNGNRMQWKLGYVAQGSQRANFYSSDSSPTNKTAVGYMESSSAGIGMAFSGRNKDSALEFRDGGKINTRFSPDGKLMKITYKTKVIENDCKLDQSYYKYIVNSKKPINIILPKSDSLSDGYTVEIDNFTGEKITYSANAKLNISKKVSNVVHATFTNNEWFIL